MRHRITLPPSLGDRFTLHAAMAAGIGKWRASSHDLARPFHGVRATSAPTTFLETVACYLPRMRPLQRFVGRTAMRLWGIPHPCAWRRDPTASEPEPAPEPLEIAVPRNRTPPKASGVQGRRLQPDRSPTWRISDAPLVDPIAAVITAAGELSVNAAVVAIDAILTASDNYPDLRRGRPVATVDEITKRVAEWGHLTGRATIIAALARARVGVESPKETETRLLLVDHGLPEPLVQHDVIDGGRLIARVDLGYPKWKIAIEYEGDGHRTDKRQWRRDIQRQRDLEDRGWIVIRLTQHDLNHSDAVIRRIRRAIADRA